MATTYSEKKASGSVVKSTPVKTQTPKAKGC